MNGLNPLFEGIRAAFHPSPFRVATTIALICSLVVGLAIFSVLEARRMRGRKKLRSDARYTELRERHQLLPSEENILGLMVATLSSMNRRHLLLTNRGLFNVCAQKLQKKGEISTADISELRVKLGFPEEGKYRIPVSTLSLPSGYPVAVRDRRGLFQAHVLDARSPALKVRVNADEASALFLPDSEVDIVYRNRRGSFVMHSVVLAQDGKLLSLSHSAGAARIKRGNLFPNRIEVPLGGD